MKISVLRAPRQFEVIEQPIPDIADDEVLLRVAACGVCTSDMEPFLGGQGQTYPRYLGHEVSGIVEAAGTSASRFKPGDRVAAWVTGRGYADYVAVKGDYVFPAGELPLDEALAEPLACAVNTVEMANISLGDDVVMIGAGFMGALVQRLALLQGPRHLIVADSRPDALACAARAGATRTVNVNEESLPDVVKSLTEGRGADVSFEVTGRQAPLTMLGDVTRMSGKVVIVGYHQGEPRQIPLGYWNWMAFQIHNAHFREEATIMRGMSIGMRLLTSGRLSLADLVTHRFPLEQINQAFQTAHEKPAGFLKSVITFSET
ncbi:MAG: zinc-binding dehydrogenase [Chloroflexi bacterium]|nr:zinc-binding dehydrogenase [Chloroflexota bacterium]